MNTSSKTAPTTTPNPIFKFDVAVTADVVDGNGHPRRRLGYPRAHVGRPIFIGRFRGN
jgi:hypothetical protein